MSQIILNQTEAERRVETCMELSGLVLDVAREGIRDRYGDNIGENRLRDELNKRVNLKNETENLWSKRKHLKNCENSKNFVEKDVNLC